MSDNNGDENGDPLESSPLLGSDLSVDTAASEDTVQSTCLWEELEQPWPSTFERSISLLASPIIQKSQADLFTKSPKPGSTALALARRKDLSRGYYTPTPESGRLLPPLNRLHLSDREGQTQTLQKMKSLDLGAKKQELLKATKAQAKKLKEAKEYRAKILRKKDDEDGMMSPGYGREVASIQAGRKRAEEAETLMKNDGRSTFNQCIFNLANILMGVGLLGLPFSLKSAGWYGGLMSLGLFGLITWRTAILIGRELNGDPRPSHMFDDSPFKSPLQPGSVPAARMLPPIRSFPDIARTAFGDLGCFIVCSILYFELFSCVCIFFVTIGDHLHQLFPTIPASRHVLVVGLVSMVPTIVLRTPTLLSYLSMVGTFATVCVVLSVIASALAEGDISEKVAKDFHLTSTAPYHIKWNTRGLALSFGLVAYCFSGHAIVPSIYTSMKKPQEFEKVVTVTFVIVLLSCLGVSVSGYYMFGATVLDQVTLSLERSVQAGTAMKALTWLMIMTAFSKVTLTIFPLAIGMEELVAPYLTSEAMVQAASSTIKVVLTGLALFVSIFVPSFSLLCALVGMICAMSVSIIFPAAAHLKLFGHKLSVTEKILDLFFIVIGSVMAVAGTIATL